MSDEEEREFEIGSDEAMQLYLAALAGDFELAVALERQGLSDEDGSLHDARRLRPAILQEVEAARRRAAEDGAEE